MKTFFTALSLTTVLCFSSLLSAQTFTDPADWAAEICGDVTSDDFSGFTDGEPIEPGVDSFGAQARPWGTLDSGTGRFLAFQLGPTGMDIDIFPDVTNSEVGLSGTGLFIFTPDLAGDDFEGFCFQYQGAPVITVFNGTDVVETIVAPEIRESGSICWLNSDLENVTRIEVAAPPLEDEGFNLITRVESADFAFKDSSAQPVDTCKSLLQDLIVDLGSIESTGNSLDDQLISYALWYLECATDDSLWSDDDHLANCNFFYYTNKATKFLSWVSDSAEVTQVLEDIQAVLSCVVENEISAATDAGGDADNLAWAEYYQECADYCQAIGNYRKASRLRKYAFACAFQSY